MGKRRLREEIKRGDEYIVMYTKKSKLNENIQEFKNNYSQYEIFTITISGTGGQMGGTMSC